VQSNVLSNYTEEEENVTLMLFFANSHNDKTLVVAKYDPTAFSPRKLCFCQDRCSQMSEDLRLF